MRLHRFYINKPLGEELVVESAGDEKEIVHQLLHVFRYQSGDQVLMFSSHSQGKDFLYTISTVSKGEIRLSFVSSTDNTPSLPITLIIAVVKKDTFETIVRQATELGVSRIIPLLAARSEKKNLNFERLTSISIEASEQSGRGTVPEILSISSFDEALSSSSGQQIVGSLHGDGGIPEREGECTLWVGPEGGWTNEEEEMFKEKSFSMLTCANTVLKSDTAAVALLSRIVSSFV